MGRCVGSCGATVACTPNAADDEACALVEIAASAKNRRHRLVGGSTPPAVGTIPGARYTTSPGTTKPCVDGTGRFGASVSHRPASLPADKRFRKRCFRGDGPCLSTSFCRAFIGLTTARSRRRSCVRVPSLPLGAPRHPGTFSGVSVFSSARSRHCGPPHIAARRRTRFRQQEAPEFVNLGALIAPRHDLTRTWNKSEARGVNAGMDRSPRRGRPATGRRQERLSFGSSPRGLPRGIPGGLSAGRRPRRGRGCSADGSSRTLRRWDTARAAPEAYSRQCSSTCVEISGGTCAAIPDGRSTIREQRWRSALLRLRASRSALPSNRA